MVTIISYVKRTKENGDTFFSLILQGGIHLVASKKTGQFYATAKKASIPSTFDESQCKLLLGTPIEGEIVKVKSEPYTYTLEGTDETVTLDYRWQFRPPMQSPLESAVFESESQDPERV
jgi:hypothetical protein